MRLFKYVWTWFSQLPLRMVGFHYSIRLRTFLRLFYATHTELDPYSMVVQFITGRLHSTWIRRTLGSPRPSLPRGGPFYVVQLLLDSLDASWYGLVDRVEQLLTAYRYG